MHFFVCKRCMDIDNFCLVNDYFLVKAGKMGYRD